jgi:5-formyltetrahydrofolate cyclo-ligase
MMSSRSRRVSRAVLDEKARIRKVVLGVRDALAPETRAAKDSLIKKRLRSLPQFIHAQTIFFFASFRSEVSTGPLMEESLKRGKRVVVPRVDRDSRTLELYEITAFSELVPGYMGIPEPDVAEERRRDINDADLVIMPGAAFDRQGNRLGYGGGYYDRLLSGLSKSVPLIAVAYEEQIIESVPFGPHDIKVHTLVTDKRVIECAPSLHASPDV